MALALVAHAADEANTLRLWAGIRGLNVSDVHAQWVIDGTRQDPVVLREFENWPAGAGEAFCSGLFEFKGCTPSRPIEVMLQVGSESVIRTFLVAPSALPESTNETFNVLLLSCFHGSQDKSNIGGRVLWANKPRPNLTIFAGDQVYLDLPTIDNFRDNTAWLLAKFQADYLANWFGTDRETGARTVPSGFPQILSLSPIVSIPDDHEYWNNAPFWSPIIGNSHTAAGRQRWRNAAETAYKLFQHGGSGPMGQARRIEVDPVSILVLDTRSQRNIGEGDMPDTDTMRSHPGDLLGQQGRADFEAWADDLVDSASQNVPKYGFLVTGQSMFRKAAGSFHGNVEDFEFPDYPADYEFMVSQLERVSKAGLPVVCLTGDVHFGRILRADALDRAPIYEIISSPTSLVESIGLDQGRELIAAFRSLLDGRDPWPRFGRPENPPQLFGSLNAYHPNVMHADDRDGLLTAMRGNQSVMLRMQRIGPSVGVSIDYIPLHPDDSVNARLRWSTHLVLRKT